ncbi:hypothetical protein ENSA5_17920 [Enhygromyxa salina]|uniref:Uncharacterized protein n=1 Tax=Enhygromyxa salina TaxID=215803 RepID=A0A2S9YDT3_9BACT|nr:hypothetical protein [Enhygromyxa salina]PRQ03171.1 hypothetical protein ENSA5_17920 [Enhygromyxa salina]
MMAATQPTLRSRPQFLDEPTFDEVVFGEGETEQRFGFQEFRDLPLRNRVHLLLSKLPKFYLGGAEISRAEAMRFKG